MNIYIKNLVVLFLFFQAVILTQGVEKKIKKSVSIHAIEENSETKDLIMRMAARQHASFREHTQREKELVLEMTQKWSLISWAAFGIKISLVLLFSWLFMVINRQKSNNSLQD